MIKRQCFDWVLNRLIQFPAVGLLGPRQTGKTTLATEIAHLMPAIYLDLENYRDLAKLQDPISYLEMHIDKLVILDEIQRAPELFATLRSIIDQARREGKKNAQYLILGSASLDLLRQSSESLAGRICYTEMTPFLITEVGASDSTMKQLWLRGGFPDSFLADSDVASLIWRNAFIKTYLERDIPQLGPRIASETLRKLWIMLAHQQGSILNASSLATNLNISGQTVGRYIDLLVDLFLLRKIKPWFENTGKRMIKSPKLYVRDSGILHALLNIQDYETLLSHPVVGMSWESFVIDNVLSQLPENAEVYFYRTARGAELDLLIQTPDKKRIAIEIKAGSVPKLKRGFYEACKDVNPTHAYVVYMGNEKYPIDKNTFAIGPEGILKELTQVL